MLFMSAIDTPLTTVPYKGTGPAMTDLLGGQVDLMCDQTTNTTGQIKARQDQGLCRDQQERLAVLPDLPTAEERGLPIRGRGLARPLRAGGHAAGDRRPACRSAADGACRTRDGDEPLRRASAPRRCRRTRRRRRRSKPSSRARSSAGSRHRGRRPIRRLSKGSRLRAAAPS